MLILGIESSCDETGAAILKITETKRKKGKISASGPLRRSFSEASGSAYSVHVLANIISSQIKKHKEFGGVVPQLAAQLHQENMVPVLKKAFRAAKIKREKIDVIAVTKGPGLIPALLVGVSSAKTLAWGLKKPLVGVNHMEGHIMAALLPSAKSRTLKAKFSFPALALLVSGGHTQLVLMREWLNYEIIGETRDDAAGEAFDKVAKMLGLGYPGGAKIEQLAKKGDKTAFNFPRPMAHSDDYDFSFSGLKTAVKNTIGSLELKFKALPSIRPEYMRNIASSFQAAVIDVLVDKTIRAAKEYNIKTLIIGGGVSANQTLCNALKRSLNKELPRAEFLTPQKQYTNDNAAMIALAGYFRAKANEAGNWQDVQANADLKLS